MTPNEHPQRLLAFLHGELSVEEAARVDAHLSDCEVCRGELSRHRQLHAHLDAATPTPVPGELWAELQPRLGRPGRGFVPGGTGASRLAWTSYLLIALLGLGVGGWAGWSMREDLGGEDSPELLAETSLYDLPEDGPARGYLQDPSTPLDEEESR